MPDPQSEMIGETVADAMVSFFSVPDERKIERDTAEFCSIPLG